MMKISVVLTTKNEERHIGELLQSMATQEEPYEIIVVDSDSTDKTQDIVKDYVKKNKNIKLFIYPGTRAESMNYGIKQATGDAVAFIGGDDMADKHWIKEIRNGLKHADIVTGKLISTDVDRFKTLENVKLFHNDINISYPGCNTTYKKEILDELGGFDPWFSSAEDLEINYRAVDSGYTIKPNKKAIVYYRQRTTFSSFIKQSFWYGYGRKLLALKYGHLWEKHSPPDLLKSQFSLWGIIKLSLGFLGYIFCFITVKKYPTSK